MANHQSDADGLHVQPHQVSEHFFRGQSEDSTVIVSSNAAAFGSQILIYIRERGILHGITLLFNASALSGVTGTPTVGPAYVPASQWIDIIQIESNGQIIDTVTGDSTFFANQLFRQEHIRQSIKIAEGPFDVVATRTTLAAAANDYSAQIFSLFIPTSLPIGLFAGQEILLRITMRPIASIAHVTGGAGSPTGTLNSMSAVCRITRYTTEELNYMQSAILRNPRDYRFHELKRMTIAQASGVTSGQYILSGITGPVTILVFVVRANSPTGTGLFTLTTISDFDIRRAGQSLTGGQVLTNHRAKYIINRRLFLNNYISDSAANSVYAYSWSVDPIDSLFTGADHNNLMMNGSEQLTITYAASLSAAVQIDVFAWVQAAVRISPQSISKISL